MFQLLQVGESGRFSHHAYRVELKMSPADFENCMSGELDARAARGDRDAKLLHSVLVHELSHFWQIASTRSTLTLMILYWNLLHDLSRGLKGRVTLPLREPAENPNFRLIKQLTREIDGMALFHLWESAALFQQFCYLEDGDVDRVRQALYDRAARDEGTHAGLYTRAFFEFDQALGKGNYELTDFPVLLQVALNEPAAFIDGRWAQLHPVPAFRLLVRLYLAAKSQRTKKGLTYESFVEYLKTTSYRIRVQPAFDDEELFRELTELSDLSPLRSQSEVMEAHRQGTFTVCESPLEVMLPFISRMKEVRRRYGMEAFLMPVWHHGLLVHYGILPPTTINVDPESGFAVQGTVPQSLPQMVAMFSDYYESCMGLLFGLIGTPEPQFLCRHADCEYRKLLLCNRHINATTKENCFFPRIVEKYCGLPITSFVRKDGPAAEYASPGKKVVEFDCPNCGRVTLLNPKGAGVERFRHERFRPSSEVSASTPLVFVTCSHCGEGYMIEMPPGAGGGV